MDRISKERRSWNMSRIRSKNTRPEVLVRSILHRSGYRFRLHARELPGRPDIVLPKWKTVIFVHGCFWHRHRGCRFAYSPKSKKPFWRKKFTENMKRDVRKAEALTSTGWTVVTVWECELASPEELGERLQLIRKQASKSALSFR
jgi:DNA mismatch endonuclease (patch repair protein)